MAGKTEGNLNSIVILGGGTAGWMTAAALSSMLNPDAVRITLVESEQIGIIGVGEATIPDIINFNRLLGIPEDEFMKATNATFKLGIEFTDWGRKGDQYFHPFGAHGADMQGIDFHHYWLHAKDGGKTEPIQDYSLCAVAGKLNKFTLPESNPKSVLSQIRYAYHFDAARYAQFLRQYAEKRGVVRVEGKAEHVHVSAETGNITHLDLERGETVSGDLFFDCTGFRALLMRQTLGVKFVDWSHWLPCDSAQAIACKHNGPLVPYTKAMAKSSGWQWRIPTQQRTGNGHIYSSQYIDDDEANSVLHEGLDGDPIGEARQLRFTTGRLDRFWHKNCIGIGLSAGFLEPLESTSIYLIQEGISRFITLFPHKPMPAIIVDEYNRHMKQEYEQVRDFIILHYAATERDDSPFWDYCRNMSIPDSLQHKIDLFTEAGRVFRYDEELFSKPSWVAVLLGQNIIPKTSDPIVSSLPVNQVAHSLDSMRRAMTEASRQMPTHAQFIKQYCPSTVT
jgi:tryptophan halogenase